MYYYNSKFDMDVEDLILDFRVQQKNKDLVPASKERMYMNKISCGLTKRFLPYVKSTLAKMNYENSAAYEQEIDKETLAQMVDRTVDAMAKDIEDIEEISFDMERGGFSRRIMLNSLVEALILTELFFARKER